MLAAVPAIGRAQGMDFGDISLVDPVGATGTVTETVKGAPGILPPGATGTVAGFGRPGYRLALDAVVTLLAARTSGAR